MNAEKLPQEKAKNREQLEIGMWVDIVLKQDQKTMTLTRGKIKDFLTSKDFHPRGVKVRLHKEGIQRLYDSSPYSRKKDVVYEGPYNDVDYIGRVQRIYLPDNYGLLFVDINGGVLEESILSTFKDRYKDNICMIGDNQTSVSNEVIHYLKNINQDTVDIILCKQSLNLYMSNYKEILPSYLSSINKNFNVYFLKEGKFLHM